VIIAGVDLYLVFINTSQCIMFAKFVYQPIGSLLKKNYEGLAIEKPMGGNHISRSK
jgi:hypothetical protein